METKAILRGARISAQKGRLVADLVLLGPGGCGLCYAVLEAARVPCVFHCAHDLGLKTAAMLHVVASSPGFTLANDCTYYGLEDDIITPLHRIERGCMTVPEEPGLGVSVDESKIAKYRV